MSDMEDMDIDERIEDLANSECVTEDVVRSMLLDIDFDGDLDAVAQHLAVNGAPYGPYQSDAEFAEEFADGIGATCATNSDLQWPYTCIDWQWAAKELMHDFSRVTSVKGEGYYYLYNY